MGSVPVVRPFHAIDGDEMGKIILNDVKNQIEADYRFKRNVAYPQFSFRWKIAIDAYPSEPSQFSLEGGPKTVKDPFADVPDNTPTVEIDLEGSKTVAAPVAGSTADAARREAGLAVPSPRAVKGPGGTRTIVDAPQVDHTAVGTAAPSKVERANVEKGGRVFARSVVQKTAAAPDGIEALPQAGSRPSLEDVQKILDQDNASGE